MGWRWGQWTWNQSWCLRDCQVLVIPDRSPWSRCPPGRSSSSLTGGPGPESCLIPPSPLPGRPWPPPSYRAGPAAVQRLSIRSRVPQSPGGPRFTSIPQFPSSVPSPVSVPPALCVPWVTARDGGGRAKCLLPNDSLASSRPPFRSEPQILNSSFASASDNALF